MDAPPLRRPAAPFAVVVPVDAAAEPDNVAPPTAAEPVPAPVAAGTLAVPEAVMDAPVDVELAPVALAYAHSELAPGIMRDWEGSTDQVRVEGVGATVIHVDREDHTGLAMTTTSRLARAVSVLIR